MRPAMSVCLCYAKKLPLAATQAFSLRTQAAPASHLRQVVESETLLQLEIQMPAHRIIINSTSLCCREHLAPRSNVPVSKVLSVHLTNAVPPVLRFHLVTCTRRDQSRGLLD